MQYAIFKLWVQKMMLALRAGLARQHHCFFTNFFFFNSYNGLHQRRVTARSLNNNHINPLFTPKSYPYLNRET